MTDGFDLWSDYDEYVEWNAQRARGGFDVVPILNRTTWEAYRGDKPCVVDGPHHHFYLDRRAGRGKTCLAPEPECENPGPY